MARYMVIRGTSVGYFSLTEMDDGTFSERSLRAISRHCGYNIDASDVVIWNRQGGARNGTKCILTKMSEGRYSFIEQPRDAAKNAAWRKHLKG